jgi:drug/metabolite transporter (DMT)-like permease
MGRQRPTRQDIRSTLWNEPPDGDGAVDAGAAFLEQYRLYIEMADRVSQRRAATNTFFLSLNTIVFSVFGAAWAHRTPDVSTLAATLLVGVLVGECCAWWLILRSYRQLNAAKFTVIGLLEEHLPASPFWAAEWTALGEGKDWGLYMALTHVERWVPFGFAVIYLAAYGFVVTA